jgi:hypothetical protein
MVCLQKRDHTGMGISYLIALAYYSDNQLKAFKPFLFNACVIYKSFPASFSE